MAPRLKILISSGVKKGTQIHSPFLSKRPGKRIPSRFPQRGPYRERYPLTEHFYTPLNILYLFISEALRKERPSMFSRSGAPMETDAHSRALTYLSGFPVKMPSPEALRTEPLQRDTFHSYSPFIPSLKVPGR
jgi:hypothetical protein